MQAFMSTDGKRPRSVARHFNGECLYTWCCAESETLAMREARAILAETEPDCRPWVGKDSTWQWRPVGMMFHYDKGAASIGFAEALQAFVQD